MKQKKIEISFGDVREKKIFTPNHFVSHMIEHIAWRMGLRIDLRWEDENWRELGTALGSEIKNFPQHARDAQALCMIDDGSAVVRITPGRTGALLSTAAGIDLAWFLGLRCEQVESGAPLVALLEGLSEGLEALIAVEVWSVEDAHHTWEGIYRGVGVALNKLFSPPDVRQRTEALMAEDRAVEHSSAGSELQVLERGTNRAVVRRGTAETGVTVAVDLLSSEPAACRLDVDESIVLAVSGVQSMLGSLSRELRASLDVDFSATFLSSSHVVMEDIGLVLGRALLEILKLRMEQYGVNAAGSSAGDGPGNPEKARAGISVEGRKFWRIVPHDGDFRGLRERFILNQSAGSGLRSEDMDDFIDGLAGGMCASVMVHILDYEEPAETWRDVFAALGIALRETFSANPYRRGVPPGVKATLA